MIELRNLESPSPPRLQYRARATTSLTPDGDLVLIPIPPAELPQWVDVPTVYAGQQQADDDLWGGSFWAWFERLESGQ